MRNAPTPGAIPATSFAPNLAPGLAPSPAPGLTSGPAPGLTHGVPVLEAIGVSRSFDVSRPWLQRVLSGTGRQSLRAVDQQPDAAGAGK